MATEVSLQIMIKDTNIPTENDFKRWVELANSHADDCEVCLRIVSQQDIQALNKQFRDKDKATNVLSFPVGLAKDFQHQHQQLLYLGDIIICHDIIAEEAEQQHKKLIDHYAHLTIHGTLHLLGYDHQNEKEADIMESLEITLLSKLNINNPYQETAA